MRLMMTKWQRLERSNAAQIVWLWLQIIVISVILLALELRVGRWGMYGSNIIQVSDGLRLWRYYSGIFCIACYNNIRERMSVGIFCRKIGLGFRQTLSSASSQQTAALHTKWHSNIRKMMFTAFTHRSSQYLLPPLPMGSRVNSLERLK